MCFFPPDDHLVVLGLGRASLSVCLSARFSIYLSIYLSGVQTRERDLFTARRKLRVRRHEDALRHESHA